MTTFAGGADGRRRRIRIGQQEIVLAVFIGLFVLFSICLKGFLSSDNMLTLLQNVAVLGILGLAMAIVVIGLVVGLGEVSRIAGLAEALAVTLRDPHARLAFWVAAQGRYVDAEGQPVGHAPARRPRAVGGLRSRSPHALTESLPLKRRCLSRRNRSSRALHFE